MGSMTAALLPPSPQAFPTIPLTKPTGSITADVEEICRLDAAGRALSEQAPSEILSAIELAVAVSATPTTVKGRHDELTEIPEVSSTVHGRAGRKITTY